VVVPRGECRVIGVSYNFNVQSFGLLFSPVGFLRRGLVMKSAMEIEMLNIYMHEGLLY